MNIKIWSNNPDQLQINTRRDDGPTTWEVDLIFSRVLY